jgi:hypothetical protein
MALNEIRLHSLSLSLRIGITCLILILAGGYIASVYHMYTHYQNKDEQPGLSMDDIVGSFHGMNKPSRLWVAIQGSERKYIPTDEEYQALEKWLSGNRISEDYDSLELGDYAPAEIIALNCLECHKRSAAEGEEEQSDPPLEYWDDVKQVAFPKNLEPVPLEILATSTHTHALTMPLVALVTCLLFLATAWPRGVRHAFVMGTFVALLLDLASWWLAREWVFFCHVLVVTGGVFGGLLALQLFGAFLDTWFGRFISKTKES